MVGGGADRCPGAGPADEPGAVEGAEAVLDGPLGHPGETDQLAGREHLVLAEDGEQVPVHHPRAALPGPEKGTGGSSDVRVTGVRARRGSR